MANGIDISQWQGKPNFDEVKKQVDFIIMRSSYGVGYKDPQFDRNKAEVFRLNIPHGYYHYTYPQYNTPEAEAKWFLQVVGALKDGEVLVLDFEEKYNGNVVEWCRRFLAYLSQTLNNYKPLIYLSLAQTKQYNWKPIIDAGYGLWLAHWDENPNSAPAKTPWSLVAMRQWSATRKFNGISGNVDANVFYGDINQFKKYGYNTGTNPAPTPTPQPVNYEQVAKAVKVEVNNMNSDGVKVSKIKDLTKNV